MRMKKWLDAKKNCTGTSQFCFSRCITHWGIFNQHLPAHMLVWDLLCLCSLTSMIWFGHGLIYQMVIWWRSSHLLEFMKFQVLIRFQSRHIWPVLLFLWLHLPMLAHQNSNFIETPSTQSSPPVSPPSFVAVHTTDAEATPSTQPNTNLMPIEGFVNDVLCRSYMSCSMLQAAWSYLRGVHANIPELVEKENLSQISVGKNPSMTGLKSHLGQIITERHKVSSPPLLPSPFLG